MWQQIKQHPWAVAIAALIHLLLLAFFVVTVDWHREISETAGAIEADFVGDPERIAEIQKQMEMPPPPTQAQEEARRLEEEQEEEERQKQADEAQRIEEEQRLEEERKQLAEGKLKEEQEQQRLAELKQQEEEQRQADIKRKEEIRLAEEKEKAELAEKKRQQEIEKEEQRQAEKKRQEAKKEQQRQAEIKRKEEQKQKKIAAEKQRKEEEQRLREAESQAEAKRLTGAMEAEEAAISSARRDRLIGQWKHAIKQRVGSKWLEPPGGASGECKVEVIQARTGTVLDVQVVPSASCDPAMQKSVAKAVKRADPLPRPKDPSIFEGEIIFTFDPSNN
jgi:colicin import membrane protein